MAKIIDYGRFAERLARKESRWGLLEEFQREWGYVDPGGEPQVTREGEAPGFVLEEAGPLPAALVEWWDSPVNSFAFRPRLYWTHSAWPPAGTDTADDPPGDEIRVVMSEYQYVNQWGYLASEAGHDDPKVMVNTGAGWVEQSRSISEFFLQLAMERLPAHFGWGLRVARKTVEDDPEIVERLRATHREMGFLPWQEMGTDSLSYGGPDVIVRHGRGPGADYAIVVQARTRAALTATLESLGITWAEEDVDPPSEIPATPEDLPPAAFTAGDSDDRGRWTVATTDAPRVPAEVPAPARDLPGRTVAASDGEVVVAGDAAGGVHAWTAEGARLGQWPLHRAPVTAIVCLPQEETHRIFSGDAHGVVRTWTTGPDGGRRTPFDRRGTPVTALAEGDLETGGALAAAWADGLVRLWSRPTGDRADLRLGTGIEALALDPSGTLHVTTANGTFVLELDQDLLWPARDLRLRLREIDWRSLRTNRGRAEEIPRLIAELASDDEAAAQAAVKELYGLMVSKRGARSAAAAAVPFLVERMLIPDNRARNTLLLLIADLAVGQGPAREAVRAVVPDLEHFRRDPHPSLRWAAEELVRICAED
ncbi:hypothetical protein [Actinocorallia longicatena]